MANLHEGHRQRLKERFLREGLDHFEPHTVLELLLFYAVPQRDTNELAHRLIARFGSLDAVFDAAFDELCAVEGIGRQNNGHSTAAHGGFQNGTRIHRR